MNTPVNFELAKLLKEKGFDEKCSHYYINDFQNFKHDGKLHKTGLPQDLDNENIFQYVKRTKQPHLCNAPTIAEVVMWLYEKHGIWICVDKAAGFDWWKFNIRILKDVGYVFGEFGSDYNSPTEAYEAAIEYTLKNLI
jgi:hypothetical protein